MLCQPFGDPSNKEPTESIVKESTIWESDPTSYEYPQMMERLEWDFENNVPFQWDFGELGLPYVESYAGTARAGVLAAPSASGGGRAWNRFLGSHQPSGWFTGEISDKGKGVDRR